LVGSGDVKELVGRFCWVEKVQIGAYGDGDVLIGG
jgi:hypothetical protein